MDLIIILKDGRRLTGQYLSGEVQVQGVVMSGRDFYLEVSNKYGSGIRTIIFTLK